MSEHIAEMDQIVRAAQARMDAGDLPFRVVGDHFPMAQAGAGNLPWMTEGESERLATLRHLAARDDSADAAAERIAAKIMRRKAAKTNTSGVTCIETREVAHG